METVTNGDIFKAMSTAIAPVFLISAVGVLLGSMSVRFGRVVDRTRQVLIDAKHRPHATRAEIDTELRILHRRARILRLTVILAVASIFSIALCVLLIFTDLIWNVRVPYLIPALFSIGLLFLLASLAFFIEDFAISLSLIKREIRVALGREVIEAAAPKEAPKS